MLRQAIPAVAPTPTTMAGTDLRSTAKRIIAARPIASVDAVGKLHGVTAERFAQFRGLVTV